MPAFAVGRCHTNGRPSRCRRWWFAPAATHTRPLPLPPSARIVGVSQRARSVWEGPWQEKLVCIPCTPSVRIYTHAHLDKLDKLRCACGGKSQRERTAYRKKLPAVEAEEQAEVTCRPYGDPGTCTRSKLLQNCLVGRGIGRGCLLQGISQGRQVSLLP